MRMNNPSVQLDVIEKIDQVCHEGREFNNYSWVPMGLGELWGVINYGQSRGLINPGQTVLDMGSGSGSSSLLWGVRGYNVIGIELYKKLADASKESIMICKRGIPKPKGIETMMRCTSMIPKGIDIKVFHGSYYPKSYIEKRENGESIAKHIEDALCFIMSGDSVFHPVCSQDVYEKHNIDLKSIDVFYAYIWGIQGPSIMEMFMEYAHDDATLCITGKTHTEIIKRIGLRPVQNYDSELYNFRYMKKPEANGGNNSSL